MTDTVMESPARLDAVEAMVQSRLGGRIRDLRVLVRDNGVVLQGRVPTYHVKQLVQHAVMECGDMRILANDIEVR